METLGACLLANDVPLSGQALDIFNKRVQGRSWADIAKDYDLKSPSSARKLFTNLTGITDYKIKGDDLLQLAKGGIPDNLKAPKVKKPKKQEATLNPDTWDPPSKAATKAEMPNVSQAAPDVDPVKAVSAAPDIDLPISVKKELHSNIKGSYYFSDLQYGDLVQVLKGKGLSDFQIKVLTASAPSPKQLNAIKIAEWDDIFDKIGPTVKKPDSLKKALTTAVDEVDMDTIEKMDLTDNIMSQIVTSGEDVSEILDDVHMKLLQTAASDLSPKQINDIYDHLALSMDIKKPSNLKSLFGDAPVKQPKVKAFNPKGNPLEMPTGMHSEGVDDIFKLYTQGNNYGSIKNKTGHSIPEIDKAIYNKQLALNDGDIYKTLKAKDNSLTAQDELRTKLMDGKKGGLTNKQLANQMGMPEAEVKDFLDPDWQPKTTAPGVPKPKPSSIYPHKSSQVPDPGPNWKPGGGGQVDELTYPKASNSTLDSMRRRKLKDPSYDPSGEPGLRTYTGGSYSRINGDLRADRMNETARKMDKSMYEVDKDFSVTRGVGPDAFDLPYNPTADQIEALVGQTKRDKGYLSTSTRPVFGNRVRVNFEVPKGARGHWVKPISIHSSEDEFLLARGTRFLILGAERQGNTWILRARVIV